MNNHHHTPPPAPRARCRAVAPLLPLLSLGALDRDEASAVASHLATCDDCQRETRDFDRLRDALRREDARDAEADHGVLMLSLADIETASDREESEPLTFDMPTPWPERLSAPIPWRERIGAPHRRRRLGVVSVIEALAALLVIALLGGLLASRNVVGPGPASTPIPTTPMPTLDPESQAYVTLLRTYYLPVVTAEPPTFECYNLLVNTRKLADLLACRGPMAAQLAAAQTLRTQLATATPPPRWQSQHTALQQAVQGFIGVQTDMLAAIDAQDITRFFSYETRVIDVLSSFCPIVTQLNAGPPPLSPALSPVELNTC
jgi:hypothetical protein